MWGVVYAAPHLIKIMSFKLKVITPFSSTEFEKVEFITVNTDDGQLQFFAYHADIICSVSVGDVVIKVNNTETLYSARQGFITFDNKKNVAELIVSSFVEKSKIETAKNKEVIDKIENLLSKNESLDSFTIKYLENQKIGLEYKED